MSGYKYLSATAQRDASAPRVTVAQRFLRALQCWQRNRTIAALQRLDDRYLENIGVARSEIPALAEKLFQPPMSGKAEPSMTAPIIDRQLRHAA